MQDAIKQRLGRTLLFLPVVLGLVVLALAVAVVVVKKSDDRPRAEVGDVFANPGGGAVKHRGEVFLPWIRLEVGAGEPRDELPDLLGADANVRAPKGGSFVQVQARNTGGVLLSTVTWPYTADVELLLRADGTDYSLSGPGGLNYTAADPNSTSEERWVAVKGHPKDLAVVVRIGDEEQVVDASDGSVELGRAAELAALPSVQEHFQDRKDIGCGRFRRTDDSPVQIDYPKSVECKVQQTLRTPYVDGIGWAEPGHEFLVVQIDPPDYVDVSVPDGAPTATSFQDTLRHSAELGGSASLSEPADTKALGQYVLGPTAVQFVFDVAKDKPAGDLTITTRIRARGQRGFAFRTEHARIEWTVPGRNLA
ncbi:hypothetical protein [Nocardioides sp. Root140]|uniref:hypothetical protein n=1 Tax=Nocardioides sp. Root140 TaxID=1736460 RepID=UPI0006F73A6B|nr:hypothetical protein [Nocardioides sp. Root140]